MTTTRDASGEFGLFVGGVGREAEGDEDAIRASREGEFSPSTNLWARMKHAAAMIRMSNSRQRTVRYLD